MPELVHLSTSDGLRLPGLFFQAPHSHKVCIFLHGTGGASVFYDEQKLSCLAASLYSQGISLLAFNNRGAEVIHRFSMYDAYKNKTIIFGGSAYELLKDTVLDIDGAITFLKTRGCAEFILLGHSTGANKVCVYDHYKEENEIKAYVLIAGGDDTGLWYRDLGEEKYRDLLQKSKEKIAAGSGLEIVTSEEMHGFVMSYQSVYDMLNSDGDYNVFPFLEYGKEISISKSQELFSYYKAIRRPVCAIYGSEDAYLPTNKSWVKESLTKFCPTASYIEIYEADHSFRGDEEKLASRITDFILSI